MSAFGFDASAARRLALGGGFCLLACALVWGVERGGSGKSVSGSTGLEAPGPRPVRMTALAIESTYPVSAWTVAIDGVAATPMHADGTSWNGKVTISPGSELLVIGSGPAADSANRCLRLCIGDAEPRLVWGGGDVTATVVLP